MQVNTQYGKVEAKIVPIAGESVGRPVTAADMVAMIDARLRALKQEVAQLEALKRELTQRD